MKSFKCSLLFRTGDVMNVRTVRSLETYHVLHRPTEKQQAQLSERIFLGLRQRDYNWVAREFEESFGRVHRRLVGPSSPAVPGSGGV
ncbi:MAG: hypothetical protein OXD43_03865 [Bacteroidetes bacterium]|nr:hypothetical protein [Bacteroidota bacterium]